LTHHFCRLLVAVVMVVVMLLLLTVMMITSFNLYLLINLFIFC